MLGIVEVTGYLCFRGALSLLGRQLQCWVIGQTIVLHMLSLLEKNKTCDFILGFFHLMLWNALG